MSSEEIVFRTPAVQPALPVDMGNVIRACRLIGEDSAAASSLELAENAFARTSKQTFQRKLDEARLKIDRQGDVPPPSTSSAIHFIHSSVTLDVRMESAAELVEEELNKHYQGVADRQGLLSGELKLVAFGALECSLRKVGDHVFTFAWKQRFGILSG